MLFQKRNLFCGRESIEYCVTVRKPPKLIDDCLVFHGRVSPVLPAELLDQINGIRLIRAILAVFEGKVNKKPLLSCHGDVEALFYGSSGESARDGIG